MKKKSLLIGMAALIFPMSMMGQYTIYPVPHAQTAGTGKVNFTNTVNVLCDDGIDEVTRDRVKSIFAAHGVTVNFSETASTTESNVYLGVNGANGQCNAMATQLGLSTDVLSKEGKFDRHIVSLTDAGNGVAQLLVLGENTDATFYGLASLEQMLDNGISNMETVTINDYADLKERGVIEGFYGKPYSGEVRQDLLRFMMRYKMNCYVYGPKSDVYHSKKWKDPYPATLTESQQELGFSSQQSLKDFTSVAHATKVSVVWAVHPGNAIVNSNTVVTDVMKKFGYMYDLGFRQFAVFVDDVGIPGDDAGMQKTANNIGAIQSAIEKKWNVEGANPADTVKPLRLTPQIYCRSFAGSDDQFNRFFKALSSMPANVTVFYTGGGVWSVPNNDDLNTVQNQFGRNVIWWWNYPCNDNGTGPNEIYPLDMKSNFVDMPNVWDNSSLSDELTASNQGILCNPMEQGEASKTAIFSAGDYSWNNRGFDNKQSWEASFKGLFPDNEKAQKAYRFIAPYLSKNDPVSLNTLIKKFKDSGDNVDLLALLKDIQTNCDVITELENSTVDGERLLYADIKPWVLRLRDMAALATDYLMLDAADAEVIWPSYMKTNKGVDRLSTADEYMAYHLSGFSESAITVSPRLTHASYRYLTPFVENYLKENSIKGLFGTKEPSVLTNVEGMLAEVSDNGEAYNVAMKSKQNIPAGGYIGIALPSPVLMTSVEVSAKYIDNVNYSTFVSANGKEWRQLTDAQTNLNTYVRYLAIKNVSDAAISERVRSNNVKLTYAKAASVLSATAPTTEYWNGHTADLMADGDYSTYVCINREQQVDDAYTIRLAQDTDVKNVRICMGTTNGDYAQKGIVQISADNKIWVTLKVAGSTEVNYSMNLSQNMVVGTEPQFGTNIVATDFVPMGSDGNVTAIKARYVRFKVSEAAKKWLRLHEIEVNGKPVNVAPLLTDNHGISMNVATDGSGITSTSGYGLGTTKGGEFIYSLTNVDPIKGLQLYCDPETIGSLNCSVSTDGENFESLTIDNNESGVVKVNFNQEQVKNIAKVKLTWTDNKVPAIYEIVEVVDEKAERNEITRVENISANAVAEAPVVNIENGQLVAKSALGLRSAQAYTIDGRTIFSQSLGGAKQAVLPVALTGKQVVVLRLTLTDGTAQSFKLVK